MTPKQIFKLWISDKPIPEKFKKYTDTWAVNKNFKIIDVTTCDYDSPFLRWAKERNAHTLVNHYLRCKLLYEFGGVYLDLDIECVKDLTPLLNSPLTVGIEDANCVNNAVIIAEKGHLFLRYCMEYMDGFKFDEKNVELETGPRLFTIIANNFGWQPGKIGSFFSGHVFKTGTVAGYLKVVAPEYFYPYHYTETYDKSFITDRTYCVHHWNQSWNEKVSIIIPCYKQAHYLGEAIESALAQTYKNIEVIVVNDGSPDNTSEVAKKYPGVIFIEQENKGLSAARNAGIKASTGKWILPLDSDDKLHPNFIMRTIFQADIVTTYLKTFGKRRDVWQPSIKEPTYTDLLEKNRLHYCSLFKREVWEKCQYNEDMFVRGKAGANGYEDWMLWLDATKAGFKIKVVPEILVHYRKDGPSMVDHAMTNHKKIVDFMRTKHEKLKA